MVFIKSRFWLILVLYCFRANIHASGWTNRLVILSGRVVLWLYPATCCQRMCRTSWDNESMFCVASDVNPTVSEIESLRCFCWMCQFYVPHVFLLSVLFTQAMAVVFLDGTVLTWGDPGSGGCSAQVQKDLYDIQVGDPSISIPLELVTWCWACLKVRNFDPCVLVLCPRDSITGNTPGSWPTKIMKTSKAVAQ